MQLSDIICLIVVRLIVLIEHQEVCLPVLMREILVGCVFLSDIPPIAGFCVCVIHPYILWMHHANQAS